MACQSGVFQPPVAGHLPQPPPPPGDSLRGAEAELTTRGRHDPAIIRRICPVLDSVTALALCDLLAQRFGTDYFTKGVQA